MFSVTRGSPGRAGGATAVSRSPAEDERDILRIVPGIVGPPWRQRQGRGRRGQTESAGRVKSRHSGRSSRRRRRPRSPGQMRPKEPCTISGEPAPRVQHFYSAGLGGARP